MCGYAILCVLRLKLITLIILRAVLNSFRTFSITAFTYLRECDYKKNWRPQHLGNPVFNDRVATMSALQDILY